MLPVIDRRRVQELVQRGAQLVEVLGPKEYEAEHLPREARNAPSVSAFIMAGLSASSTSRLGFALRSSLYQTPISSQMAASTFRPRIRRSWGEPLGGSL